MHQRTISAVGCAAVLVGALALGTFAAAPGALGFAEAGDSVSAIPTRLHGSVVAGVPTRNITDRDVVLLSVLPLGVINARIGETAVASIQVLPDGTHMAILASPRPLGGVELRAWSTRRAVENFIVRPSEDTRWNALYVMEPIDPSKEARVTSMRLTYRIGLLRRSEVINTGVCFFPADGCRCLRSGLVDGSPTRHARRLHPE